MTGARITDRQVRRYMDERRQGDSQATAAAKAGFSERTARRIDANPIPPSQRPRERTWRTREDPFAGVWDEELVPVLRSAPHIRATTLLEELQRRHPGDYPDRLLRSLQRRVALWRATEGPEQELIFRQDHPPGYQALSDFTETASLGITIDGIPFDHLLYHFWLAYSGWEAVKLVQGGESFTALTEGLQEALWQLGGVPHTHRTDRLSAAYRNLTAEDDEAAGYAAFCRHYGMTPTRNNAGVAHENGSVEAAHGHLKAALRDALDLRGSRDFPDIPTYQAFLQDTVARKNARRRKALEVELPELKPLPRHRTTDFSTTTVTVTRSGTISVRKVLYTVPSRLVGCRLKVHLYDDRLLCWLGTTQVLTLARKHPKGKLRDRVVDYRHLAASLVRKPQAFRRSVFRDELFPRPAFRRAWEVLDEQLDDRQACRVYVGLLHLAATGACEAALAEHLDAVLDRGGLPDLEGARTAVAPPQPAAVPLITVAPPDLAGYDRLLRPATATPDPEPA
ncbi:IS21 family transposase [Azospirillum brasilense]|uniref:IS21 family transposase n=1 Tax=Azospirillum brasilense TaxID=192 RepID=UPI001EDBEC4D|nr:IS21 family transposase [Azospirillum brasilense]UKJ76528.1 IS21 family transposase [Azospirillum brasilense]UKJ77888.1 IS21 family transposase [Azospirillum brasilense]